MRQPPGMSDRTTVALAASRAHPCCRTRVMASSTRPSMLSSPPQNPSPSEADKRRASSSHSRRIASFISRDSVGCATTPSVRRKRISGAAALLRCRDQKVLASWLTLPAPCKPFSPSAGPEPWRNGVGPEIGRALEIKSRCSRPVLRTSFATRGGLNRSPSDVRLMHHRRVTPRQAAEILQQDETGPSASY